MRFRCFGRLVFLLCFLGFAVLCMAQNPTAVVKRAVYLRNSASANDKSFVLLKPRDELELLDQQPTNDFLHVRTQDGKEGWVKAGNVTIREQPERIRTTLAAPSGVVADQISSDWEKPDPNKITLQSVEGTCPWNGDNSDPDTFVRKNRSDTAESDHLDYHDVKWEAIAHLAYPVAKPLRKNWTSDQLAQIKPYEGIPVRAVGYIVAYKPQNGGSGEGTNCHFSDPSDTDTHMALAENAGDAEKTSVVVEFTPRFLKAHPNWNRDKISKWVNSEDPVRISGWLMLDPDHRNHLNRFRSTLWEIHPITRIEVWKDNQWVNADELK